MNSHEKENLFVHVTKVMTGLKSQSDTGMIEAAVMYVIFTREETEGLPVTAQHITSQEEYGLTWNFNNMKETLNV